MQMETDKRNTMRRSAETPATTAQRAMDNEERAILSRDGQLIGSGEDPKKQPILSAGLQQQSQQQGQAQLQPPLTLLRGVSDESSGLGGEGVSPSTNAAGSGSGSVSATSAGSGQRLTRENMAKLEGQAGRLARATKAEDASSLNVSVGEQTPGVGGMGLRG